MVGDGSAGKSRWNWDSQSRHKERLRAVANRGAPCLAVLVGHMQTMILRGEVDVTRCFGEKPECLGPFCGGYFASDMHRFHAKSGKTVWSSIPGGSVNSQE